MSEPAALPPPETQDEPAPEPPPPPPRAAARDLLPWLSAAGFLILAVALFLGLAEFRIQSPRPRQPMRSKSPLDARVSRLEQRPHRRRPTWRR